MSPPGDGVLVPGPVCVALAKLAVIGARKLQEDSGGLVLAPGLATVIAELARFTDEPGVRSVGCTASGDEWISTARAAAIAGVGWRQIARLCRRGRLIARRDGYAWQVSRLSAEDYRRDRVA